MTASTSPKRQRTIRENKLDEIRALYAASTNSGGVGDNGFAAYQTVVEWLDWFSPVNGEDEAEKHTNRTANQFDGVHTKAKLKAADYVLQYA